MGTPAVPAIPSVYLAGPTVFESDPDRIFDQMKDICARHQLRGLSPLDNQIGLEAAPPGRLLLGRIVQADIDLMHRADFGVFCMDGFRRSPEMDPGTAFEIGYMHALGKPLAGWTRDEHTYPGRVAHYFETIFDLNLRADIFPDGTGGRSGVLRDPDGILVHSEGCYQNAMTQIAIERGGGGVHAHRDWLVAFERAIIDLEKRAAGAPDALRLTV